MQRSKLLYNLTILVWPFVSPSIYLSVYPSAHEISQKQCNLLNLCFGPIDTRTLDPPRHNISQIKIIGIKEVIESVSSSVKICFNKVLLRIFDTLIKSIAKISLHNIIIKISWFKLISICIWFYVCWCTVWKLEKEGGRRKRKKITLVRLLAA